MADAVQSLGSTLDALTSRYRAVAHNLANANTVGFKKRRSMFAEALAHKEAQATRDGGGGGQVTETSVIDFTQGTALQTGRPLDLCLTGEGFFTLETPQGRLYTRNGAFHINANRQLVDSSGRTVAGANGPISLPAGASPSDVTVSRAGRLSARGVALGQLRITQFAKRGLLRPVGQNTFQASEEAAASDAEGASFAIQQGFQEGSNVTMVEELIDLITVSRLYEANLKSVSKQDDRMDHLLRVAMA